jgi:hypothetical protein
MKMIKKYKIYKKRGGINFRVKEEEKCNRNFGNDSVENALCD